MGEGPVIESQAGLDLLEEILAEAGGSVSLQGRDVVFKHLIVQPKMIPLPVFLETASRREAERAA